MFSCVEVGSKSEERGGALRRLRLRYWTGVPGGKRIIPLRVPVQKSMDSVATSIPHPPAEREAAIHCVLCLPRPSQAE